MKTELLNLTPEGFCRATDACKEGCEFAERYPTMAGVWEACDRPAWLLWILFQLEAEGLPEFAQGCADRASEYASSAARSADAAADDAAADAAAADAAADDAYAAAAYSAAYAADAYARAADADAAAAYSRAAAEFADAAADAAALATPATRAAEEAVQVAEIKRRWGNPFKS